MAMHRSAEQVRREIIRACHIGSEPLSLLQSTFDLLQRAVPADAWFCATIDPATLLYTGSRRHEMPEEATPLLLHNEFMEEDFNKLENFAREAKPASSLYGATGGMPERSRRYREIFVPMGLGDELRGALRAGGSSWGFFCLHRELAPAGFSDEETEFIRKLLPHIGEGIRTSLLLGGLDEAESGTGPGLLLLSETLDLLAVTPMAEQWLSEMGDWSRTGELPAAILMLSVRLQAAELASDGQTVAMPRVRVHTQRGRWVVLHASRLEGAGGRRGQIAIIFEQARPMEVAPLLLEAYTLTVRETDVARLVLQGWSTEAIVDELCISAQTIQQHLKAVFEKVGVRSRRELVAQIFHRQYLPRMLAGEHPGADGAFTALGGLV